MLSVTFRLACLGRAAAQFQRWVLITAMAIDPIDYEKFKRMGVPYGLYFGLLQMPVAWVFTHWFSVPIACALSLGLLTLFAYPVFIRGLPIYFFKWRTGGHWTFLKWLLWTLVMGLVGFAIGNVIAPVH
jgi:hypothetical protein